VDRGRRHRPRPGHRGRLHLLVRRAARRGGPTARARGRPCQLLISQTLPRRSRPGLRPATAGGHNETAAFPGFPTDRRAGGLAAARFSRPADAATPADVVGGRSPGGCRAVAGRPSRGNCSCDRRRSRSSTRWVSGRRALRAPRPRRAAGGGGRVARLRGASIHRWHRSPGDARRRPPPSSSNSIRVFQKTQTTSTKTPSLATRIDEATAAAGRSRGAPSC